MDWKHLLSPVRYEPDGVTSNANVTTERGHQPTAYEEDAQRIISATAFRRLQGKTQVYPFPQKDFMRTRLTHTIEVANAAHALGDVVGKIVREKGELPDGINPADIADICAAAAYAHDLGNPPFGHIGEYAIQSWFTKNVKEERLGSTTKYEDFTTFDGNAQGFRIITRLQGWRNEGGLQLSTAVLGAFAKYPWSSEFTPKNKAKYGFTVDDTSAARKIFGKHLGMNVLEEKGQSIKYCRHPLAYVTEAADDICYLTTDIEDGVHHHLVKFEDVEELFLMIAQRDRFARRYNQVRHKSQRDRMKFLRAAAICSLRDQAVQSFEDHYDSIMNGRMHGSLLENSSMSRQCKEIRDICVQKIYVDQDKIEIEAAGYTIIQKLLTFFNTMICHVVDHGTDFKRDKRLENAYFLLSAEARERLTCRDPYRGYLILIDFISGMTDRYALELYQKIEGHSVSLGRML